MRVLAIVRAAGQGLGAVLEPMCADQIWIVGNTAQVTGVGAAAFAFSADADKPFQEQTAIDRSKVEFADQRRLTEPVKTRPFFGIIGERAYIAVETDDVAPA